MRHSTEGTYRVDVRVAGEVTWATNALRFDDHDEARVYAFDLTSRWLSTTHARVVVDADTPNHEPFDEGDERIVWPEIVR